MKLKVKTSKGMFTNEALVSYGKHWWYVDIDLVYPKPTSNIEIDSLLTITVYKDNYVIIDAGINYIDSKDIVDEIH